MKRQAQTRHKPEEIRKALEQLQSGRPLSEVAKSCGVSKSLIVYWRDHAAEPGAKSVRSIASRKSDERTRRFVERCWRTVTLAFKKLDAELMREKPVGIRDLALAIAVIRDKLTQAEQSLNAQVAPSQAGWAVSEDTLLLLRTHREAKVSGPPANNPGAASLDPSGLEPQKGDALPAPATTAEPAWGGDSSQPSRDGAA